MTWLLSDREGIRRAARQTGGAGRRLAGEELRGLAQGFRFINQAKDGRTPRTAHRWTANARASGALHFRGERTDAQIQREQPSWSPCEMGWSVKAPGAVSTILMAKIWRKPGTVPAHGRQGRRLSFSIVKEYAGNSQSNFSAAPSRVERTVLTRSGSSGLFTSSSFPDSVQTSAFGATGPKWSMRTPARCGLAPTLTTFRTSEVPSSLPQHGHVEVAVRRVRRGRDAVGLVILRGHLLGVVRRHAPHLAARQEHLALVPVVVVLLPRLEAVGGAVDQHEIAVPLRRVEDVGVAEGPAQVVPAAVLLQHARLQLRAGRPFPHQLLHAREQTVHVLAFAQVVAADVNVPQRRLAVQLAGRSACSPGCPAPTTPR